MQRQFNLEELSLTRFIDLCKAENLANTSVVVGKSNRFCRIVDRAEYCDLSNLIFSLEQEDQQNLKLLWDPKGGFSIYQAAAELMNGQNKYLLNFRRQQPSPRRVVAKLAQEKGKEDAFIFDQESGAWVMRYFRIAAQNFELYDFNGMDVSKARSILGVYSRDHWIKENPE